MTKRLKYRIRGILLYILYTLHIKKVVREDKIGIESQLDLLPVVAAASLLMSIVAWFFKLPTVPKLWIRKGSTVKAFPVLQSIRIARKHGWEFVETEPVRRIGRREALKILIKGDSNEKVC